MNSTREFSTNGAEKKAPKSVGFGLALLILVLGGTVVVRRVVTGKWVHPYDPAPIQYKIDK